MPPEGPKKGNPRGICLGLRSFNEILTFKCNKEILATGMVLYFDKIGEEDPPVWLDDVGRIFQQMALLYPTMNAITPLYNYHEVSGNLR